MVQRSEKTTTEKELTIDRDDLLRVQVHVRSAHHEPTTVTLVEKLPAAIGPAQLGAIADPGEWRYESGELRWGVTIEPNGTATSSYVVAVDDPDHVATIDTPIEIRSVEEGQDAKPPDGRAVQRPEDVDPDSIPDGVIERVRPSDEPTAESFHDDRTANDERAATARERADETAHRYRIEFDTESTVQAARSLLESLHNGTTVLETDPERAAIDDGAIDDAFTVTLSTSLDADRLERALENLDGVAAIERQEIPDDERPRVEGPATDGDERDLEAASAQPSFDDVERTAERTDYREFRDEVEELRFDGHDFGDEPVSFEELVGERDAGENGDAAAARTDGAATSDGTSLVDRLATELEEDRVSEEERVELRRRLGIDPAKSTEVRLDHLHGRVDEIAAYADALEEFIDENGSGRELLEDLEATVEDLDERLTAAEERLETAEAERDDLRERLDDVEAEADRIETVESSLESTRDDVDDLADELEREFESVRGSIEDLTESVDAMESRLEDVESKAERNSQVRDALSDLSG